MEMYFRSFKKALIFTLVVKGALATYGEIDQAWLLINGQKLGVIYPDVELIYEDRIWGWNRAQIDAIKLFKRKNTWILRFPRQVRVHI